MEGYWEDPNRGKVPMTWGFNPLIAKFAPTLVEFYAHSATSKDSFWGFTAGYTHTSCFSPKNFKLYAEDTRRGLVELGISPAVDIWDSDNNCSPSYEELSKSSEFPGVKLMSILPSPRGPETFWLDNGAVVMRNDKRFHGMSQKNGKTTLEGIISDIKEIEAQYPGMDPKFLTVNTRVSPTFVKEIMGMLPKNVVVVGMPDFIGLAEESGAVVASPYSDAVGAGDSVKVKFQLHNASGQTGKAGESHLDSSAWMEILPCCVGARCGSVRIKLETSSDLHPTGGDDQGHSLDRLSGFPFLLEERFYSDHLSKRDHHH